ncbi:MAG TPA: hypothetical protein VME86_05885 [Acidobacteriaceae bacterium]|nr:hypothetical protein [Acidobacteriaceae bacterium]
MNYSHSITIKEIPPLFPGLLLTIAIGLTAPCLHAQTTSLDQSQSAAVIGSLDQNDTYPVQAQMAETSNLNSLNENADTSKYTDNSLTRGPIFFALETTGTWTTNLQDTYSTEPSTSGEYVSLGAPVGIHLSDNTNDFGAFFRVDTSFYPGYSGLNHTSEIYSHQLVHRFSDITTGSWSLAGGHVVTLGRYLPPVIGVGSTDLVVSQQASGLQAMDDAATSYTLAHQTSARDTVTASGTAGWIDEPVPGENGGIQTASYRQLAGGGALQWQRALNTREKAGVEVTDVYVKGLSPTGSSNFVATTLTFSQTLTPHSTFTAGAGPLFAGTKVANNTPTNYLSYAANAGVIYRTAFGDINAGYARVYAAGYLTSTNIANELYLSFDRPITSKLVLTADTQYLRSSNEAQPSVGSFSEFGFTARLDMHITRSLVYQIEGSSFTQSSGLNLPGYKYDNISGGVTFYFGNPLSRTGDR